MVGLTNRQSVKPLEDVKANATNGTIFFPAEVTTWDLMMFVRGTLVTFRRSAVHPLSLGVRVVVHEGCGHHRKWSLIINPFPEDRKSQARPFVQSN